MPQLFGGPLDGLELKATHFIIWFRLDRLRLGSDYLWALYERYERGAEYRYLFSPPVLDTRPPEVQMGAKGLAVVKVVPLPEGDIYYGDSKKSRPVTVSTWTICDTK